jgi:hypothetical protein
MSYTQGVNLFVQDNGLGQSPPGQGNTEYVIGIGSTGPYWQVIQSTNPAAFQANGTGPGVEMAGFIANSTGNPVAFVAVPATAVGANASYAGVANGVTVGASNISTSVVTLSGTPNDSYYGQMTVVSVGGNSTAGTVGTVGTTGIQVQVSLDNNRSVYQTSNLGTATTLAVTFPGQPTTGLTLNFAAGTLCVGDTFKWISTEPVWSDAAIQSAINCMLPLPSLIPEDIIVVGGSCVRVSTSTYSGTVSAGWAGTVGCQPSDLTAFDGYMTTLFNKRRFNNLICQAGDAQQGGTSTETEALWLTSLETNFASIAAASLKVGITGGHYNCISPFTQAQFRRPLLFQAAARDSGVAIQVDLGRVLDGALANTPASPPTSPDGFIYHDEQVNPGLDAARFISCWSLLNRPGLFIKNPNMMVAPGSDFNWLQHGHVMNAACLIAYDFFVEQLSNSVRVSATTGFILPQDAMTLQTGCNTALATGLTNAGAVSAATCTVSQTDNILSTSTLTVKVSIVPLGYLKAVSITLVFTNPATIAVSQPTLGPQ